MCLNFLHSTGQLLIDISKTGSRASSEATLVGLQRLLDALSMSEFPQFPSTSGLERPEIRLGRIFIIKLARARRLVFVTLSGGREADEVLYDE